MKENVKYGIGQQSFEQLRNDGCLYVDKTHFIEKIVTSGTRYYFLGRPRRFGKSLFLSMLKCFFEGKRELFSGLYADSIDWDWKGWPVLYLDFNVGSYKDDTDELEKVIDNFLFKYESLYGVEVSDKPCGLRLANVIEAAAKISGRNVVVLVDEYDKPLVNNIHNPALFEKNRQFLSSLYANFKSSADYLRLVFLTGVSQFGKLSVFSSLNNISDISFDDKYASICGITHEELLYNFQEGIKEIASYRELTDKETVAMLKEHYDGYHFGELCPDIYNPYSLLNVMDKRKFFCYWVQSGTPTLLAEALKKQRADLNEILHSRATQQDLSKLDADYIDIKALLYQTGYLTIKGYDARRDDYLLGLPNEEVKKGFLEFLLPYYANVRRGEVNNLVFDLIDDFEEGRAEMAVRRLRSMFANYDNRLGFGEEANVRNAMMIIFDLIGLSVKAERATSAGRIDILVETAKYVYILELKFDGSAHQGYEQIERRDYVLAYALDSRQISKIALNFSSKQRTFDECVIDGEKIF